MKKNILLSCILLVSGIAIAQKYPTPEFSNEIYFLKKDSVNSIMRLEKNNSKMETQTKAAGFGGVESGYTIEGAKSPVRLQGGNLSFIYYTGESSSSSPSNPQRDSMLRANGADPAMMDSYNKMSDPSNSISLYKVETSKGERKILTMKSPGMSPFGSKKMKSSDKLTLSIRKIREGYWELIVDKALSKGEYAFTLMNAMSMDNMTGDKMIFAFGID